MNNNRTLSLIFDFAEVLMSAVLAVTLVFSFCFKTSVVSGDSMTDTLHHGDTLFISAVDRNIENGDVAVISQPNGYGVVLIKRVIAKGGQTITFDRENEQVLVDGVVLDEPYIKEKMNFSTVMDGNIEVPQGKLFVMGDNRNWSADSRDFRVGLIDERYVVGTVIYRVGDNHFFEKDK